MSDASEDKIEAEDVEGLPPELQEQMEAEQKKLVEEGGVWYHIKTKDGELLTGRFDPEIEELPASFGQRKCVGLRCVVRYLEVAFPTQAPSGRPILQTIGALRPDFDTEDRPSYIPLDFVARVKMIDAAIPAAEFIRLKFREALQAEMSAKLEKEAKEMEEMFRRAQGSGLALPGQGIDPRNIPPQVLAKMRAAGLLR
jgi:hypothetical protein